MPSATFLEALAERQPDAPDAGARGEDWPLSDMRRADGSLKIGPINETSRYD